MFTSLVNDCLRHISGGLAFIEQIRPVSSDVFFEKIRLTLQVVAVAVRIKKFYAHASFFFIGLFHVLYLTF